MNDVLFFARQHPGSVAIEVARYVAPSKHGRVGLGFGYRTLQRAIAAGLVRCTRHPHHAGRALVWPSNVHTC